MFIPLRKVAGVGIHKRIMVFAILFSWLLAMVHPVTSEQKQPEKRHFTEAWIWQYRNDWMPAGDIGQRGEILIYRDNNTNSWLFDNKAYGRTGAGFDFIVGEPNGQYVFCFRNEKKEKRKSVRNLSEVAASRSDDQLIRKEFEASNSPTGVTKTFDLHSQKPVLAKEYVFVQNTTGDKTYRYLAETTADFQSVVFFNFNEGEAKLPFPFPTDVPLREMLLGDSTTYNDGRKIVFELKRIDRADLKIDLSDYK